MDLKCLKMLYFALFQLFWTVFGPFRGIWELGRPVLVGDDVVAKCLNIVLFTCFRAILDLFGGIWMILG